MASAKEDRSHDESSHSDKVLNLRTVQKMLPLVKRIADDVVQCQRELNRLEPQEQRLQREKRTLTWVQRQGRYRLQDEMAHHDRILQDAVDELRDLGVVLLDSVDGRVGFPTLVNNRAAYFTWKPGDDGLHSWQFVEENVTRPIPPRTNPQAPWCPLMLPMRWWYFT